MFLRRVQAHVHVHVYVCAGAYLQPCLMGEEGGSDVVVKVALSHLAPPVIIISSLSGRCAGVNELATAGARWGRGEFWRGNYGI